MFDELGKSNRRRRHRFHGPTMFTAMAALTANALAMEKHVYCQKPLTQTVLEAPRKMRRPRQRKKKTGKPKWGKPGKRPGKAGLRRGLCRGYHPGRHSSAAPRELHVLVQTRPIWPQGHRTGPPAKESGFPPHIDLGPLAWDPAAQRPYKSVCLSQFSPWRGWYDFGHRRRSATWPVHTRHMPFPPPSSSATPTRRRGPKSPPGDLQKRSRSPPPACASKFPENADGPAPVQILVVMDGNHTNSKEQNFSTRQAFVSPLRPPTDLP